jgi:hypothetical protein
MKAHFRKLPQGQQGSFYSTVIIVAMFGLFLTAALKIAPAYMDHNVVVDTMEGISASKEFEEMTVQEISASLMKTMNVNNVSLPGDALKLVNEGSQEFVEVSYETRVPLFYNISAVVSFSDRFEKN